MPTHKKIHSCKPHKATLKPKLAREYFFPPEKNYFLKFPSLLKILKPQPHSRHKQTKHNPTMTAEPLSDQTLQTLTTRTPAGNRRLAKVAVQCSADTFVVNQTLVLRINICGKNRHLRQAPNRYHQFYNNTI